MRKNISHKTYIDHWISTNKYCVVISSSITVLILSTSLLTLNCDKFVRAFYWVLWAAILSEQPHQKINPYTESIKRLLLKV